jgi:antitoxin (DNA-binding transcriptional repressor) of toxin-antitoxin stability system
MTMAHNLADAEAHLSELVQRAMRGEEVIVADENRLRIVAITPPVRQPGTGKGVWISPDFDEPLDDFRGIQVMDAVLPERVCRFGALVSHDTVFAEYGVQRIW